MRMGVDPMHTLTDFSSNPDFTEIIKACPFEKIKKNGIDVRLDLGYKLYPRQF